MLSPWVASARELMKRELLPLVSRTPYACLQPHTSSRQIYKRSIADFYEAWRHTNKSNHCLRQVVVVGWTKNKNYPRTKPQVSCVKKQWRCWCVFAVVCSRAVPSLLHTNIPPPSLPRKPRYNTNSVYSHTYHKVLSVTTGGSAW